jgi:tryptophan synthase beta subunit
MSLLEAENGYYGEFGGAFVPEMLRENVKELETSYQAIIAEPEFQQEFQRLMSDYVGRPSPLYLAKIYLKDIKPISI